MLKKVLLVIIFLLNYNLAEAAWYNNHTVPYTNPGSTVLGGGSDLGTWCDDDVDGIDDSAYRRIAENNSSSSLVPHSDSESPIGATGNLRCLYWDASNPTGSAVYSGDYVTKTVTITCNDTGGSNCDMRDIVGWTKDVGARTYTKSFTTNTSGSITIYDLSGNSAAVSYNVTGIDAIAPTGSVSYTPTTWTNQDVTVTITCNDTGGSNCDMRDIVGWTKDAGARTYTKSFMTNTSGSITIYDIAGNSSTATYNVTNIDKNNPTGVLSYSTIAPTNNDVIVTVACSDTGGSNCVQASYTRTVTANGTGTIAIADNAGNTANIAYTVSNIDKGIPSGNVSYSTLSWTNQDVTVTITCNDTGGSNCDMRDIVGWTKDEVTKTYAKLFTTNTSGNITIYDVAGNSSTATYNVNNIDKIAPTADDISGNGVIQNGKTDLVIPSDGNFEPNISATGSVGSPINIIELYYESGSDDIAPSQLKTKGTRLLRNTDTAPVSIEINTGSLNGDSREYSLKIARLCDEAGNCMSSEVDYAYTFNLPSSVSYSVITEYTGATDTATLKSKVIGNYNGKLMRVSQGGVDYIFAIPSMIVSDTSTGNLNTLLTNGKLVFNGYSNLPSTFSSVSKAGPSGFDFNKTDILIYQKPSSIAYNDNDFKLIANKLREFYNGTVLMNNSEYRDVVVKLNMDNLEYIIMDKEDVKSSATAYWQGIDRNCNKPDITINVNDISTGLGKTQIWAGCNSTFGTGVAGGEGIGNLYIINNINSACPSGWSVPTDANYKEIERALGCTDYNSAGWRCQGLGNESVSSITVGKISEFLDIPESGYKKGEQLFAAGTEAYLWTNTTDDSGNRYIRSLYNNSSRVNRVVNGVTDEAYSVRCIKN